MIIRAFVLGAFGFLSCVALANVDVDDGLSAANAEDMIVADNRRRDRRDGRQDNRDDKQECRQEEGRIGNDKRECKQDNRGEGDEAEVEGDKEPEGTSA